MNARNPIAASLSTEVLEFDPYGDPASFQVRVINQREGNQLAQVYVDLSAAGAEPRPDPDWWFELTPERSAAVYPGDPTVFTVVLKDNPIPGARTVNVTVTVRLLEGYILRLMMRLLIRPRPGIHLRMRMPQTVFTVRPRGTVALPVEVQNMSHQPVDVVLRCLGLDPSWLPQGPERRVMLAPGQRQETQFACQPPVAAKAPARRFPFVIAAAVQGSEAAKVEADLDILPVGMVMFECETPDVWIPYRGLGWPTLGSPPAVFALQFKNASNVSQVLTLAVKSRHTDRHPPQISPPELPLEPGQPGSLALHIQAKRPLLGSTHTLKVEAIPQLSNPQLEADPPQRQIKVHLRPLLPLWLQAAFLVALLALLLALLPREKHDAPVNVVRFSGVVDPVLSGSQDQTVRAWRDNRSHLLCRWIGWQRWCLRPEGVLIDEAQTGNLAVTALRYQPENNRQVALGLENGIIQRWDVNQATRSGADFTEARDARNDRVLDLLYNRDSRFLFSGHGSGTLRQWDLQDQGSLSRELPVRFAIYSLALSRDPEETILVAAGRENSIVLWNWQQENALPQPLNYPPGGINDYVFSITTVAPNWLAIADTLGRVTLLDLAQCQAESNLLTCGELDAWRLQDASGNGIPIRSIAMTQTDQGSYYLASGSDDGTVRLWRLTSSGQRDRDFGSDRDQGLVVARYPTEINSVDLIIRGQQILIVSGSADQEVRTHTMSLAGQDAP